MLGATYFGPSYFGAPYFGGAVGVADEVTRARVKDRSRPYVRLTDESSEDKNPMKIRIDGQRLALKRLHVKSAHHALVLAEVPDDDEPEYTPWLDAPNIQVAFCSDFLGATVITGLGPETMVALDATVSPGYYEYTFPVSALAALDVAAYWDKVVFQRITAGAANEVLAVSPFLVCRSRFTA